MKSKSNAMDSWKNFWVLAALMIPFAIFSAWIGFWFKPPESRPSLGFIMTVGLILVPGPIVLGIIDRWITGRNHLGGLFVWTTSGFIVPNSTQHTLADFATFQVARCLVVLLLISPFWLIGWIKNGSKSRMLSSPLADPEIDARPLA